MTTEDKFKFGYEIIAAMKSSVYGVTLKEGRDYVKEETSLNYTESELNNLPAKRRKYLENETMKLKAQALEVALVALQYLEKRNLLK